LLCALSAEFAARGTVFAIDAYLPASPAAFAFDAAALQAEEAVQYCFICAMDAFAAAAESRRRDDITPADDSQPPPPIYDFASPRHIDAAAILHAVAPVATLPPFFAGQIDDSRHCDTSFA